MKRIIQNQTSVTVVF